MAVTLLGQTSPVVKRGASVDDAPPPSRPRAPPEGRAPDDPTPPPEPEGASPADTLKKADAASQLESSAPAAGRAVQPCPLKARYAVEAQVVDAQGAPVADVTVELRQGEAQALTTLTDADGLARFDGLANGAYTLCLPSVDKDAWKADGTTAIGAAGDSHGDASWAAPSAPAASVKHTVEQGEGLSELAAKFGYVPATIWDAPENAALKEKRKSPNVLAPGDVLTIPAAREKTIAAEVATRYRLSRLGASEMFHLRFLDDDDKPRARVPYLITLALPGGDEDRAGETDGDGYVNEKVPPDIDTITILLGKGEDQETYQLRVGHLDPVDTTTGVQARLRSLGYAIGDDEEGEVGPYTKRALREFQEANHLEAKGALDDATRKKLEDLHLS